jgi:hypothetical protein
MGLKENVENHPIIYWFSIVIGAVISFAGLLKLFNQEIIPSGSFRTLEEINVQYVLLQKYKQQEASLVDYRAKYFKADAEMKILKSAEPKWAIQIGTIGYQTIDEAKEIFTLTTYPPEKPVFNKTDMYKFNDYYFIFKYDRDKTKEQLAENLKSIRLAYPDLQCEIIDLGKYCLSGRFVKAEDFTCGENGYVCITCN